MDSDVLIESPNGAVYGDSTRHIFMAIVTSRPASALLFDRAHIVSFLLLNCLFVCAVHAIVMDLNDLRVPMLKAQLLARDRDARGTKNVLVGRLRDALQEEGVNAEHFVAGLLGAPSSDPLRDGASPSDQQVAALGESGARDFEAGGSEPIESRASHVSVASHTRDSAAGPPLVATDTNPAGSVGISAVGPDAGMTHDVRDVRRTDETAARDPGAVASRNDRDVLEMVAADGVEVHADDSASQVNCGGSAQSGHSSGSARSVESLRIRESAKQAALRVRMKFLKDKHKLEVKEHELRMKREELKLQAALEESQAREAALTPSRLNSVVSGVTMRNAGDVKSVQLPKKQLVMVQSEVQHGHRYVSSGMFSRTNPGGVIERSTGDLGKPVGTPKQQLLTRQPEVQQTHQSFGSSGASSRSCRGVQKPDIRLYAGATEVETSDLQTSVMKRLLTSSLLPKPEVPIFSGDVTKFHHFLRAFDSRVDVIVEDDESKAYYLEQFTSGIPKDIVRGCMYLPSGGYREARCLLQKRYGDPDKVANAFVDRVLNCPVLKADDVAGLDRFALELRTCFNAVGGLRPENNELDHPKTMRRLLEKVPYSLQDRWRRRMDGFSEREGRRSMFGDLVLFIEEESRIASDPTFGRQVFTKRAPSSKEDRNERLKATCCASNGDNLEQNDACVFCKGSHTLEVCPEFPGIRLPARQNFVRRNGLCFGCLKPGHQSRCCKERLICAVCGRGHPSVLHFYGQVVAGGGDLGAAPGEPSSPNAVVNVVSVGRGEDTAKQMPIIPVKVKCRGGPVVETYAFLDSGSSSSFCSLDLAKKLDATLADKKRLTISTIAKDSSNVLTSAIEGLTISGMDGNHVIHLPAVFAIDQIPAGRRELCRPEDLEDWPLLQDVLPGEIDADVGLLIGVDVPTALEPVDITPSRDGGPFAVKTRLGWVVSGPVRH